MNKTTRIALCCALLALGAGRAAAEDIYRCGDSYSQKPCPGGKVVQVEDARSASQRAQTSQAAQRDAKAADAMEKARLKEEGKPAQALLPPPKASEPPPVQEGKTTAVAKAKKPAVFKAVAPKKPGDEPKKKKKAKTAD